MNNEINSFDDLNDEINSAVQHLIETTMVATTCEELGIDRRAYYGPGPWVSKPMEGNYLVVKTPSSGALDYYGGFEYVEKSAVRIMGDYTVYDGDADDRIMGHVRRARNEEEVHDDEDEDA